MMRTFTILLLLGVMLMSKADSSANVLSSEEKLQMLNHFRTIRDRVAPSSESMKLVNWDEELEAASLKWISQCIVGPDPSLASVNGQTYLISEGTLTYEKGYAYAALQSSTSCFCGDTYGRLGRAPEADCGMSCGGNPKQMCGGGWRNSIYKVPYSAQRDTNIIDSTTSQSIDETSNTVVGIDSSQDYIGCYIDDASRDLNVKKSGSVDTMTVEYCRDFCRGNKYAALQYSTWCFCGDTYGRLGKAPEADCGMSCGGNKNQMCGGGWRNSIYKANPLAPENPDQ